MKQGNQNGLINTIATIIVLVAGLVGLLIYWQYKSGSDLFCAQVVVRARNPLNGEIKEFGTPCDVPKGWEEIENSVGSDSNADTATNTPAPSDATSTPLPLNEEQSACIQVITRARNMTTGEERDFPTPCDVPQGWQIVAPTSTD